MCKPSKRSVSVARSVRTSAAEKLLAQNGDPLAAYCSMQSIVTQNLLTSNAMHAHA